LKLALVYKDAQMPSSRVRALNMAPHLRARGVACECWEYPDGALALRQLLRKLEDADLVVLQKRFPTLVESVLWRGLRARVVFDVDDAVMLRQRPRNGSYESPGRMRRFRRTLSLCDGVICGNEYLASFARGSNRPILVAPSPVPVDVPLHGADRRAESERGLLRIGWIGTRSNLPSLEPLAQVLRSLSQRRELVLRVISNAEFSAPGVRVENVRWSSEGQARELAELDVGVMPMEDTPWSRGKCAYKLLQYMAARVAAVASPVGMNRELVRHGENGMLASTPSEWSAALESLCGDDALRDSIAGAGRATILRDFSYERIAQLWIAFFEELLAAGARER
jgi:glycosyltransferase involved in cell wall biosynthesis